MEYGIGPTEDWPTCISSLRATAADGTADGVGTSRDVSTDQHLHHVLMKTYHQRVYPEVHTQVR